MKRILIVDDHPLLRKGIRQILEAEKGYIVEGEAGNADETFKILNERKFDIVILDITLPETSGLEVLKRLKKEYPALSVLIFSVHAEEQYAVRALKAGASGYLSKESTPEKLMEALNKIAAGENYLSSYISEKLITRLRRYGGRPPHESLSDREYQVFCRIAKGNALKDIAKSLSLSAKTISAFRSRILAKMEMKSNAEMVRYALDNNLVD